MNWRRILLLSAALVSVLAVATWALLQNSDVGTEFVRRQLKEAFAADANIASTSVQLAAGRLTITDFELADPTTPQRKLVRIRKSHVDVAADPFGAGVQLRHIAIEGLEIECGPTWPTLASLLKPRTPRSTDAHELAVPAIELRSGTARIRISEDTPPLAIDAMQLTLVPLASDATKLQLRGSLTLVEPPATFAVTGEFDLATGAAHITIAAKNVTCSEQAVSFLAKLAKVDRQNLDVGGEIASLSVTCVIPPTAASDRTPTLQISADCRNVRVRAPHLPAIVRNAKVKLFADTAGAGTIQATVEQSDEKGDLWATTEIGNLNTDTAPTMVLRATARDVIVDDSALAALRTFPIGKELVAALQPTSGRANLELFLKDPHTAHGEVELDLTLRDGTMSFLGFGEPHKRIGFPLQLEHASGRVRLRNNILLLEQMHASIPATAGGGDVTLQGRIETKQPAGEDTSLDIHGDNIAFSPELRTALSALLRDDGDLYQRLSPSGRATVHVIVRPASELEGSFGVDIQPLGAAMRWQGFPYRLDNLRGSIRVRHNDARFDLTGRHGDGGLTMRGRIPLRAQHSVKDGFEAVIDIDQLTIDEDLQKGVAVVVPELDEQWQLAAPTGRLSGKVKVWRPQADDPLFHDVRLSLDGVNIKLPLAPWRATGLHGQVLVQGSGPTARIDFNSLRGQLENDDRLPAQLALLGHIESGPEIVRDLAFVVRDLDLCEQLGRSLSDLGALDFATWTSLKPSGRVDLVCRERAGGEVDHDLQVVVQLVDVRSEAPMLPKPAEHLTGELHIEGGELSFRDVRGNLGSATVHCTNGRVHQLPPADGRTEITFDVHAKDFPIDDGLANLFSGPVREAVRERHLRGQADVDGLRLRFAIPSNGSSQPFSTTISGLIGLDGLNMQLGTDGGGIRVLNLHGLITLTESTVTEAGGQIVGTLERGSLSMFGHPFDAVEAAFTADAERLTISTLKTRIHDGELRNAEPSVAALTYLLPAPNVPEGRLSADLQFDGVDIVSLLTTSGWQNPPYSGTASGRATLRRLDGSNVVGAEAEGTLQIERADLGKVPLFKAIYAQLPPADQPRFNHLDLTYRLTEQEMVFDRLDVRSDILAAKGTGKLNLDGYLDVKMELDNLLGQSADPLVMPFIDYLAKNLVSFRLYGHLRELRAATEIVGGSAPTRPPVMPMPPAHPKAKTPGY